MSQVTNETIFIDRETIISETDHTSLRLWLRMLASTTLIENCVRKRLRIDFDITLPRFDLMAQLARHPEGLRMGEISQRMMVSGGNITGITDQLEKEGLVERVTLPDDRRVWKVRLTAKGNETFREMAAEHENWIADWMSGLTGEEQHTLYILLGKVKRSVQERHTGE